jgi:hypothetical protein
VNNEIQTIFTNFQVSGVTIPVAYLRYTGKATTYITYQEIQDDTSFSADDELQAYVRYYDFDIYSKSNYLAIIESVKEILKANGWRWQPSMTSQDLYEDDTGYYHKTLCFAKIKEENNG